MTTMRCFLVLLSALVLQMTAGSMKLDKHLLLDGYGLSDVLENTDDMVVIGITSLDASKCKEGCTKLMEMFITMKPLMKGFYESHLLEIDSVIELPAPPKAEATEETTIKKSVHEFFNISSVDLPAIFIFPYGARSLNLPKPETLTTQETLGMVQSDFVFQSAKVKLWEASVPMHLNANHTLKIIHSYEKRPKDVHDIFLGQLPNRVDILDGANITKWVSETLPGRKDWAARAILSSDKDRIPALYTKLAIDYCCSGRIRFGYVKAKDPNSASALKQLKIEASPTLLIGKDHNLGTGENTDKYEGKLGLAHLRKWAEGYDTSRKLSSLIPEVSDEGVMNRECGKGGKAKTWCFILIMPDDIEVFEDNLEIMAKVAGRRYPVSIPHRFLWIHGGRQKRFLDKFVGEYDAKSPAVLAMRINDMTPMYSFLTPLQFSPKHIRKGVMNVLFEMATFQHMSDKLTMIARQKKVDLENIADDEIAWQERKLAGREL